MIAHNIPSVGTQKDKRVHALISAPRFLASSAGVNGICRAAYDRHEP